MPGFQTRMNNMLPPAIEGDFASANPIASALSNDGRLVAGSAGLRIGRFAWLIQEDGIDVLANTGTGQPAGFVHRNHQAIYYALLDEATMTIPQGYGGADTLTQGDFWVRTTTAATRGQKVFASTTDGSVSTGDAGATVEGSVETKFTVASDAEADELIKITSWM